MNRPSDARVRQAIETIFDLNSLEPNLPLADTDLKSRTLLRYWPLSRVERLEFRSRELPSVILKCVTDPLQSELTVYEDLFSDALADERRWTPRLYGHAWHGGDLWMFFEDIGFHTLKSQPSIANLNKTIITLAGFHVAFEREVANGTLQKRSHLLIRDYANYISRAKQVWGLVHILVNRNIFPAVTNYHLDQLEAIVETYERVALGLISAPQTLVHGDFNAYNLAVAKADGRIVLLDWANAYIGAGLVDLVDLSIFAIAQFGFDVLPLLLQSYRLAYRAASGESLATESLEELFVCSQIEKKMSIIRWYCQCSLKWMPSAIEAYDPMVAGLIDEAYELSTILA